jgi:hypothetical protein
MGRVTSQQQVMGYEWENSGKRQKNNGELRWEEQFNGRGLLKGLFR